MNAQDKARLSHLVGFYGPEVDAALALYKQDKGFHTLKNIIVEWNKSDAQRGIKFIGFLVIVQLLVGLVWLLVDYSTKIWSLLMPILTVGS